MELGLCLPLRVGVAVSMRVARLTSSRCGATVLDEQSTYCLLKDLVAVLQ